MKTCILTTLAIVLGLAASAHAQTPYVPYLVKAFNDGTVRPVGLFRLGIGWPDLLPPGGRTRLLQRCWGARKLLRAVGGRHRAWRRLGRGRRPDGRRRRHHRDVPGHVERAVDRAGERRVRDGGGERA